MTDLPVPEQMEAEVAASQEIITRAEAEIAKAQATIKVLEPAIKGLRSFGNGKPVRMAPARRSTGKPTKRHPAGPGHQKTDWDKGREMWGAGVSVEDIARHLGVSGAGVRYRAKADGWPARPRQAKGE